MGGGIVREIKVLELNDFISKQCKTRDTKKNFEGKLEGQSKTRKFCREIEAGYKKLYQYLVIITNNTPPPGEHMF